VGGRHGGQPEGDVPERPVAGPAALRLVEAPGAEGGRLLGEDLADGVRLAFNRDYMLIGSVRATPAEWDAALVHSLDTCAEYRVNDRVPGEAVWFEVCSEAREPYRRSWIEKRAWGEEREG
jgi:hypothetical protein